MSATKINEATPVTLCADSAARTLSSANVLTTIAVSGAHRHFGMYQNCAYLGGEMCLRLDKWRAGRPSDAYCSEYR
jgi:hypothetical protein